ELNAGTDAVVRSTIDIGDEEVAVGKGLVDRSAAEEIAQLDGVRVAAAAADGYAQIIGADGKRLGGGGPPTIASSWIDDEELAGYQIDSGRPPAADGEVVIDKGAADKGELRVGDTTTVLLPQAVEVTIVG